MITVDKAKAMDARAAATSGFCGVLFLDIVSFSRMAETGQAQALCALDRIIAMSDAVVEARQYGKVQVHPRGDGKLLIFSGGLFPALHAAAQIASDVLRQKPFELRMGIHYGPVRASDPRMPNSEVVGDGVNTAQRIMDCGDAGHILLSHSAAKWAGQNEGWSPLVRFSGHCAVKHGVILSVYSLHGTYRGSVIVGKSAKPSRIRYYQQDTQSWERNASPPRYLRPVIAFFCVGILAILAFSSMRPPQKKVTRIPRPGTGKPGKPSSTGTTIHSIRPPYIRQQAKSHPRSSDLPAVNPPSNDLLKADPTPPDFVGMPDLRGDTEEVARKKLAEFGLKLVVVKVEPNADTEWVTKGVVYEQFLNEQKTLVTVHILNDNEAVKEAVDNTVVPSPSAPELDPQSP